jgi:phage regulator Rha-like protein
VPREATNPTRKGARENRRPRLAALLRRVTAKRLLMPKARIEANTEVQGNIEQKEKARARGKPQKQSLGTKRKARMNNQTTLSVTTMVSS